MDRSPSDATAWRTIGARELGRSSADPAMEGRWLGRVRALLAASELVACWAHALGGGSTFNLVVAAALACALLVSNALVARLSASRARIGVVLTVDTLQLACVLGLLGGAANPFSVLFLVNVTLAALLLDARWAALLGVVSALAFAVLFFVGAGSDSNGMTAMHSGHHQMGHSGFRGHLYGMFAAYVMTAAILAFVVARVARELERRKVDLAEMEQRAMRAAHVEEVHRVAAMAAHELGTPLGTIAIAASELMRRLATESEASAIREDAELVCEETRRCRNILEQLNFASGQSPGERIVERPIPELGAAIRAALSRRELARVDLRVEGEGVARLPVDALARSVGVLARNALEASRPDQRVEIAVRAHDGALTIDVVDEGTGISDDVLDRLGEPFVTTHKIGEGLGLGVFLVSKFAASVGGELTCRTERGVGTLFRIRVPRYTSMDG